MMIIVIMIEFRVHVTISYHISRRRWRVDRSPSGWGNVGRIVGHIHIADAGISLVRHTLRQGLHVSQTVLSFLISGSEWTLLDARLVAAPTLEPEWPLNGNTTPPATPVERGGDRWVEIFAARLTAPRCNALAPSPFTYRRRMDREQGAGGRGQKTLGIPPKDHVSRCRPTARKSTAVAEAPPSYLTLCLQRVSQGNGVTAAFDNNRNNHQRRHRMNRIASASERPTVGLAASDVQLAFSILLSIDLRPPFDQSGHMWSTPPLMLWDDFLFFGVVLNICISARFHSCSHSFASFSSFAPLFPPLLSSSFISLEALTRVSLFHALPWPCEGADPCPGGFLHPAYFLRSGRTKARGYANQRGVNTEFVVTRRHSSFSLRTFSLFFPSFFLCWFSTWSHDHVPPAQTNLAPSRQPEKDDAWD